MSEDAMASAGDRSGGTAATMPGTRDTTALDADSMPGPRAAEPVPGPPGASAEIVRSVQRHLDEILASVPVPDPIELAVLDAQGLLCAEEVVSTRALPPVDQAALDGYAARSDDVVAASVEAPVLLSVVGESHPGAGVPA